MSLPLILAFLWLLSANIAAMIPSKDRHWRRAYILIAVGIPLVGWVTAAEGPILGLIVLAAGVSVLRWPVIYLARWLRGRGRARPAVQPESASARTPVE